MAKQELVDYIKQQLQQGVERKAIKSTLRSVGWHEHEIEEAFNLALSQTPPPVTRSSEEAYVTPLLSGYDLLRNAWTIYKKSWRTFAGIMLVPIVAQIVLLIIGALLIGGFMISAAPFGSLLGISSKEELDAYVGVSLAILKIIILVVIILLFISYVIIQTWNKPALLYAIEDRKENIGVKEAYRRGWHKIIPYWWIGVLGGFITLGGYLLFIVPGIIFSVWFSLAAYILIAEDLKGMAALLKSREYVRGRWLSVFWRFVFLCLFFLALLFIGALLLLMLAAIGSFACGTGFTKLITSTSLHQSTISDKPMFSVLEYIFGAAIFLLITPFAFIYTFLIYENLKALKGTFAFTSSHRSKFAYLATGFFGFALFAGSIIFLFVIASRNFTPPPAISPPSIYPTPPPISTITPVPLEERRDRQRSGDLRSLQSGLEIYYSVNQRFPATLDQLTSEYMLRLPADPKTNTPYDYKPNQDGKNYILCIDFELKDRECFKSEYVFN